MKDTQELMERVIETQDSYLYNTSRQNLFEKLAEKFSIIPLYRNTKVPIENEWQRCCVEKNEFVKAKYKYNNAGICCGPASGLLVLDVDNPPLFEKMLKDNGIDSVPETFSVTTGMKGYQNYYTYPSDGKRRGVITLKHDDQKVGELRGVGGQVVAPGSRHPDTKRIYVVRSYADIVDPGEWLLKQYVEKYFVKKQRVVTPFEGLTYEMIDLKELDISEETKWQINNPWPRGERSEQEMSVICKLVIAGVSDSDIHSVFEHCQIGEKHRERGNARFATLDKQIQKAWDLCLETIEKHKIYKSGIKTLGEINSENKQIEYLIEGFWPKNENMILFGTGGCGKSLLSLSMAAEIACPSEEGLFGMFKVNNPGRVLFFQSENSEAAINARIQKNPRFQEVLKSHGDKIGFVSLKNDILIDKNIEDDADFKFICNKIEQFEPAVVVFDPLVSFHRRDENANSFMRAALDCFTKLQTEYNLNVLIIHHSSVKSNSNGGRTAGRGATSIFDWCRNSIELKRVGNDSSLFQLEHHKASDFSEFGTIDLVRDENLHYTATGISSHKPKQAKPVYTKSISKTPTVDFAVKILEQLGDSVDKQQDLIDKMNEAAPLKGLNMSNGTAYKLIKEALDAGKIKEVKGPGNSKGLRLPCGDDIQF